MSLEIDRYEHLDDVTMRLNRTAVLYKGDPVYIYHIEKNPIAAQKKDGLFRVYIKEFPVKEDGDFFERARRLEAVRLGAKIIEKPEEKQKPICSKHFDISPFKLGYVNTKKGAFFCSRLPNRMQRQGLCGENFSGIGNDREHYGFNQWIQEPNAKDMVHNAYPSFEKALKNLKKDVSIAFSRDFSIGFVENEIGLFYKARRVGTVVDQRPYLLPQFVCLQEVLEENKERQGWI